MTGAGSTGLRRLVSVKSSYCWSAAAITLVLQLIFLVRVTAESEIPEHAFNAQHALSGGTGVSPLDPVTDPGETHPAEPFKLPAGVAVDSSGDLYVVNQGER